MQTLQRKPHIFGLKTGITAGKVTVYGTPTCPWCTKQRENFDARQIQYDFVDCGTQEGACPDIVKGYPTTVISGFHEF